MADIGLNSERINHFFKGEYTDKDTSYIDDVFCDDSKEGELRSLLFKQFNQLLPESNLENKKLDQILYRIHFEINTRLSETRLPAIDSFIKWTLRVAGILVLPLIMLFGIRTLNETSLTRQTSVEIKAPTWSKVQFSLPDGTTGWLNSNSSIKYDGNFITKRNLTLRGEAFFNVYKDKKRPFIVNTSEVNLTVLGTRFNIESYDNEKDVEVVLEEGKLVFMENDTKKSYSMRPNDLLIYDKNLKDFKTEEVNPRKYLAWTEGKLEFRNDPLDVIVRRLERWYNIEIELDVSGEDLRWHATFNNEGPEEVLNLMKRSLNLDYRIEKPYLQPDGTYTKEKVVITSGVNKVYKK